MKTKRFAELAAKERADPVQRERIAQRRRALEAALRLAEVRARRGMTQREVAAVLAVSQANVSRIEHDRMPDDRVVGTVRPQAEARAGTITASWTSTPRASMTWATRARLAPASSVASSR